MVPRRLTFQDHCLGQSSRRGIRGAPYKQLFAGFMRRPIAQFERPPLIGQLKGWALSLPWG